MRQGWEAEARNWVKFARPPGHDHVHDETNLPALLDLLPGPGRATLDVACGEADLPGSCSHSVTESLGLMPRRRKGRDAGAPFVISASYLDAAPLRMVAELGDIRLTFHSEHRPLETYARALEASGLLIEAVRE